MKKYFVIFIVVIVASLFATIFLVYHDRIIQTNTGSVDEKGGNNSLSVFISGTEIFKGHDNIIPVEDFKIDLKVEHNSGIGVVQKVELDTIDLLSETFFFNQDSIIRENDSILFALPSLILPGKHLILVSVNEDGENKIYEYSFTLGFETGFDRSLNESNFFVIPETSKLIGTNIFSVADGKLKVEDNRSGLSSLGFLYLFSDVSINFDLVSDGEVVNLAFYFLDSGKTFVLGNGNDHRMTLLRTRGKENFAVEGKSFTLIPGETYRVNITKKEGTYMLYLKRKHDPSEFQDNDKLIEFKDISDSDNFSSLGFSSWEGGDGATIDNLSVIPLTP